MRSPVSTDKTGPVNGENHVKLLHADIVHNLVISPLKKGRIYGKNRDHAAKRQPCRKCHRMFLRNSHVKVSLRESLLKGLQPGSLPHGRGNSHQVVMKGAKLSYARGKNIGIGRPAVLQCHSASDIKSASSVILVRMTDSRLISLPLLGDYMNQDSSLVALGLGEDAYQIADIVAVNRTEIHYPHILKKHARNHQMLQAALRPPDSLNHVVSQLRNFFQLVQYRIL